jgi:hypothetical protein
MLIASLTSMPRVILWKSYIPFDNNLQKAFKTIRFDVTEATEVPEHFAAGVPFNGINIFIEVPKSLEECRKFNAKLLQVWEPRKVYKDPRERYSENRMESTPAYRFNDSRGFIPSHLSSVYRRLQEP